MIASAACEIRIGHGQKGMTKVGFGAKERNEGAKASSDEDALDIHQLLKPDDKAAQLGNGSYPQ